MMIKKALYLAGGGARGAYQAGVLKAIGHILQTKILPFDVVSGVSVGSINGAILAEHANNFPEALNKLESIWGEIHCQQIYKASNYELSKSVMKNLSRVVVKNRQSGHLLDTSPLKEFLYETIDFDRIEENIAAGHLQTFETISACYETHQSVSFYTHYKPDFEDWNYPRHKSQRAAINVPHLLSSSALPLFFPPIYIDGLHYGDGGIGLAAPLRGVIRFQVDKILIIGTREMPSFKDIESQGDEVAFAQILGSMMNGLFLDNLDRDIELVNRMNEIATLLSIWRKRRSPWRPISMMHLRPSKGMASVAQDHFKNMPVLLRYFLNILGAKHHSGDLLSFLLFEKEFTRELLDLGYKDTIAKAQEISKFFD